MSLFKYGFKNGLVDFLREEQQRIIRENTEGKWWRIQTLEWVIGVVEDEAFDARSGG